jgi:hypothetical protein
MSNAHTLDLRDARSQIFEDIGLTHGIQETRGTLIRSLYVLAAMRPSQGASPIRRATRRSSEKDAASCTYGIHIRCKAA